MPFHEIFGEQHNDHVIAWIAWRTALCGILFVRTSENGTRTYLDPEDVYLSGSEKDLT